ncbi:MAG: hypothetical protein FJ290_22995 [Planctomycetes bacterium]|nr:hypothetical protein [Planctomycetota bacterium]
MPRNQPGKARRLGDVLVEHGLITAAQRRAALKEQRASGGRLGEILVRDGLLSRDQLNWALGNLLHIPYVRPDVASIDPGLLSMVPLEVLRRCEAVPMALVGDDLTVAMADPTDVQAVEALRAAAPSARVHVAMADAAAVHQALNAVAERGLVRPRPRIALRTRTEGPVSRRDILADTTGNALLRRHLLAAVAAGADEVLLQRAADALRVRTRLRGRVVERATYPAALLPFVVHRLRLLAGLDLASVAPVQEREVALDVDGRCLDARVSIYATLHGPAARLDLRRRAGTPWPLNRLGFDRATAARLQRIARAPAGLVVVCGPQRSGCSTTLYALLRAARTPGRHLATVEQAASHLWPEATQLEAPGAGYLATVAELAKAPPDVLLAEQLHERDFWAAFNPHALTSTLLLGEMRATDAVSALGHLRDAGLTRTVLANSLRLVVAQRLARRPDQRQRGAGSGLTLLYEALEPDQEFRDLLLAAAPVASLREACRRSGMRSLADCADDKAAQGLLDPDEAERVRSESPWTCFRS